VKRGDERSHTASKKPLFYRNPMRADVTSPVPAKDEMGMDYIPVYAEEAAAPSGGKETCVIHDCPMEKAGQPCPMLVVGKEGETVECPVCRQKIVVHGELKGTFVPAGYASVLVSPQKQQLIGIRTAPVVKKELHRSLRVPGTVAYDPELYALEVEYLKEYRVAQGTLRGRELAFKNLQDSRWEAPRIEVVKSKLIRMGLDEDALRELVDDAKADETLLYLKPDGDVWAFLTVPESDAPFVHKGDAVRIQAHGVPGKVFEGTAHHVASAVDPQTRRVHVHVRLKNENGLLRPDMLLDAEIESPLGSGLAVPEEAVFFTGTAAIVFVDKGNGLFEPREVRVGPKAGDEYQVLEGISEGERVVVNGNFLLDSESKLKASIERAQRGDAS
jgi:Cu(I)/Ag(I) efflux system membrane fusion protein